MRWQLSWTAFYFIPVWRMISFTSRFAAPPLSISGYLINKVNMTLTLIGSPLPVSRSSRFRCLRMFENRIGMWPYDDLMAPLIF